MPHKHQKVLSEVFNFVLKSKARKRIGFPKTSIYWTSKGAGRRFFTKQTEKGLNNKSISKNKCLK